MKNTVIYKYNLHTETVSIPRGYILLSVQMQGKNACMWASVSASNPVEVYKVHCIGTGQEEPNLQDLIYIGTVQEGPYVWHYYLEEV